jgi:cob(I)alamin adenosyltransferase
VSLEALGKGFVGIQDDKLPREEHVAAARATLEEAQRVIQSARHHIVILDEVNVALQLGLLGTSEVLEVVRHRPAAMHVVCTGRGAPPELVELADLVTEMREIKHPFQKGLKAQRGFDF